MTVRQFPPPLRFLAAPITLTGLVGFVVGLNIHLNHFWADGGFYTDSGWFAWLSSQSVPPRFPNPSVMPGDFIDTHLSPIFWVYTMISRTLLAPLHQLDRFAVYQGLWVAAIMVGVHLLVRGVFKPATRPGEESSKPATRPGEELACGLIGVVVGLSGVTWSVLAFPHVELGIPAAFVLAAGLWINGQRVDREGGGPSPRWAAPLVLLVGLNVREDAGLHYFAFLASFITLGFLIDRRVRRPVVMAAVGCVGWAVILVIVQKLAATDDRNLLVELLIGDPPYAHLSTDLIAERATRFTTHRVHLWLPLLLVAVVAGLQGRWRAVAGHLAVVPWLVVILGAFHPRIASFETYYAFPLIITLVWPLVDIGLAPSARRGTDLTIVGAVAAASVLSAVLTTQAPALSGLPHPAGAAGFDWVGSRGPMGDASALLTDESDQLGSFVVDDAVAVLMVPALVDGDWFYRADVPPERRGELDTIVIMEGTIGHDRYLHLVDEAGLECHHRFPDTRVIVCTRTPRPDLVERWGLAPNVDDPAGDSAGPNG